MASPFDIQVQGNTKLTLKLNGVSRAVKDLRPAFVNMSPKIVSEFKKNVDSAGSLLGRSWPKRQVPKPWPILNKSGKLKNTWDNDVQKLSLKIFNPVPYSKFHNFGTIRLPVRAIVGVNNIIINQITKSITNHLKKAL